MASCLQKMPISLLESCVSYKFFILLICIRIFNICLSFQCCPSGISKQDCKKKRPVLHSPGAYQQPCCVSESDCFCVITSIYTSRVEHFSRRKETIQHYYYHERMPFLILFDKRMGKSQVRKSCTLTKCKALLNAQSRAWVLNLRGTKGLQGVREYGSELLSTSLNALFFTIRKVYHHHLAANVISKTKLKRKNLSNCKRSSCTRWRMGTHITFPCWFSDWLVVCWSQAPRQICCADFSTLP